jgi:hypothetical protein
VSTSPRGFGESHRAQPVPAPTITQPLANHQAVLGSLPREFHTPRSSPTHSTSDMASMRGSVQRALVLLLAFTGLTALQAQVVRTDMSPVCNSFMPQCEAKCKRGETFIYVCSAGNGPRGGPYIICRCAAPKLPVGPPQQGESRWFHSGPGPTGSRLAGCRRGDARHQLGRADAWSAVSPLCAQRQQRR